MSLDVDIDLDLGETRIEARFEAGPGITALFGRSGAGKTSIVNAVAGLLRPRRGRIAVGNTVLFDAAGRVDVPRHRRGVGYVFQDARLFPHLTVRQNLLYGRWFARRRAPNEPSLERIVELLGIDHLLGRRPGSLSGGERQRVAIGRALLARPRILLMDEPLASLDAARKAEILPYLERLRDVAQVPTLYVSHALDEVTRLADTIVLLSEGRTVAAGPLAEILGRLDLRDAVGRFEAGAILTARVVGPDAGLVRLAHPAGALLVARPELPAGSQVRVRVRARDVAVAIGETAGLSIRNRLAATVREISAEAGPLADVALDVGGEVLVARLTRASVEELGLVPGRPVTALLKTVAVERRGVTALPEEP